MEVEVANENALEPYAQVQPLVRVPKGPSMPTERELEEHEATGCVIYRSWCPHCVRAKATVNPHWKSPPEEENAVPTILMDYMFMGQDDDKSIPMLQYKIESLNLHGAMQYQPKE